MLAYLHHQALLPNSETLLLSFLFPTFFPTLRERYATRYGWDWKDDDKTAYVINPEEAAVRFSIFHMYVELDMSRRSIAHKLTEENIPTPTRKRDPDSERGAVWPAATIYDFLRDTANIGVLTICERKTVLSDQGKVMRIPNPDMKVIPGGLPRIIPQS